MTRPTPRGTRRNALSSTTVPLPAGFSQRTAPGTRFISAKA